MGDKSVQIILGSASKGRKEVLARMGYEFTVMAADIDERAIRFDDPKELTLALAHAKADALLSRIHEPTLLITSDQVVAWNGHIREKPENEMQAREYLRGYSLHPAETVTAVVITNTAVRKRREGVDVVRVSFFPIPEEVIHRFIKEGDPFSRAGGFSIKNPILKEYVERVDGAEDSVIGLPKELTERLMEEAQE